LGCVVGDAVRAWLEDIRVALENLHEKTEILEKSLSDQDLEKAHEAISVMLMQCTETFGIEHLVMKQILPV
jgi:hypothetical protein